MPRQTVPHALPAHRYQPLYLHISRVDAAAMLRMIVTALGERPSLGRDRLFRQILDRTREADAPPCWSSTMPTCWAKPP